MNEIADVVVVGSGNAALCAALAARERGASVLVVEKAPEDMAGGNIKYTAGAMCLAYESGADLHGLLRDPDDSRIARTDFGAYPAQKFRDDPLFFNHGRPLSEEQHKLVERSLETMQWLASQDVKFEPIYARQSFEKEGRFVFWGGLTLAAQNEGVGVFEAGLTSGAVFGRQAGYGAAKLAG